MDLGRFEDIREQFSREIVGAGSESEVLDIKGRYTGKKRGVLQDLMASLKGVSPEERPAFGQAVNALKTQLEQGVEEALARVRAAKRARAGLDIGLTGIGPELGHIHPVTLVRRGMEQVFISMS